MARCSHILVEPGTQVVRGQRLAIIEAMKMEHTLAAPTDGTVADISAAADAQVAEGANADARRTDGKSRE